MEYREVTRFRLPAGSTAELRCMVNNWDEEPLISDDLASVSYVLYEINPRKQLVEVDGYTEEALDPVGILYDTPQSWDRDDVGYNFHHVPPNRTVAPFMTIGKTYRLHYVLTPANALLQLIVVPFEIEVI